MKLVDGHMNRDAWQTDPFTQFQLFEAEFDVTIDICRKDGDLCV
jgi:hypothetical protein